MMFINHLGVITLLTALLCATVKLCQAQRKIHLVVLDNGFEPYPVPASNRMLKRRNVKSHHRFHADFVYGYGDGTPSVTMAAWDKDSKEEIKMRGLIFMPTSNYIFAPLSWSSPIDLTNDRWAVLPTPFFIEQTIVPQMKGMTFTYNLAKQLNATLGLYLLEEPWLDHKLLRPSLIDWKPVPLPTDDVKRKKCVAEGWAEKYHFNKEENDEEKARLFPTSKPKMALTFGTYQLTAECVSHNEFEICQTTSTRFNEKICSLNVDYGTPVLCKVDENDKEQHMTPQFMAGPLIMNETADGFECLTKWYLYPLPAVVEVMNEMDAKRREKEMKINLP